ncbi:hypothetical protein WN51_12266 [Melipona quadrifasciata]|uniref:Uncharacterized protein n=1 Tax=Melipona quadrifasciata TaxID=166423 RepID=A0A0N0BH48_9HYME|nr:hypothetical protein WN51_12266 [Melipona quadrifasciata]
MIAAVDAETKTTVTRFTPPTCRVTCCCVRLSADRFHLRCGIIDTRAPEFPLGKSSFFREKGPSIGREIPRKVFSKDGEDVENLRVGTEKLGLERIVFPVDEFRRGIAACRGRSIPSIGDESTIDKCCSERCGGTGDFQSSSFKDREAKSASTRLGSCDESQKRRDVEFLERWERAGEARRRGEIPLAERARA